MPHGDRYGQPPPTAANSVNPSAGGGIRGFAVPGPECLRPAAGGRLFREPGWRRDRGFQPSSRTAHLEWANLEWTNLEWTNEERTSKSAIRPTGFRSPAGGASSESSPLSKVSVVPTPGGFWRGASGVRSISAPHMVEAGGTPLPKYEG